MRRGRWLVVGILSVGLIYAVDRWLRHHSAAPLAISSSQRVSSDTGHDPAVFDPDSLSATEVLSRVRRRTGEVQDYQCTVTSQNKLGNTIEQNVIAVAFKKPGLFRHAIVSGAHEGVVITRDAAGRIKARPGGILGIMVVPMNPSDERLRDGRGEPFYASDWETEFLRWERLNNDGAILERLPDRTQGGGCCWVLRLSSGQEIEEAWIDSATDLPRRLITMREGEVVRDASYADVSLNVGLADDAFLIR